MTDLPAISRSTLISFPQGETRGVSEIIHAQPHGPDKALLFVAETPFYPLSHSWPDQQSDLGTVEVEGQQFDVTDVLTAATQYTSDKREIYLDKEIPVRKFDPMWLFLVAHVIDIPEGYNVADLVGQQAALAVDERRRRLLSATHTSTHAAGLALNKQTAALWRKEVPSDSLGNPDLDRHAMARSVIGPGQATDRYRFGKSLRKKGFDVEQIYATVEAIARAVNEQVGAWVATGGDIYIAAQGPTLDAPRSWRCTLDGKDVDFPCGGTHLHSFSELSGIDVSFTPMPDEQEIEMRTVPALREQA